MRNNEIAIVFQRPHKDSPAIFCMPGTTFTNVPSVKFRCVERGHKDPWVVIDAETVRAALEDCSEGFTVEEPMEIPFRLVCESLAYCMEQGLKELSKDRTLLDNHRKR